MKKLQVLYITAFFAACLVPSLGMAVTKQEASSENRRLAEFPELKKENEINTRWLPEAGEYFQEHFAFRNELVTANALLNGKIFGVSTADGVIQGTDNWLYYKDSLEDYLGEELLSERSLFNIAHTLAMMQETLNEKGVQFLFTVAPNKNSLYGENMPYYDSLKVSSDKNLVNLQKYLRQEQVSYGDLYEMLYPLAMTPEEEVYYDRQTTFAYVGEVVSNFDPKITTVNPVKEGSLVMFRDSFGNALLPFMADAYSSAYFSRGVPYQMSEVDEKNADTVIVERAERFLPEMAQSPPIMEGPECQVNVTEEDTVPAGAGAVQCEIQGNLEKITGCIEEKYLDIDSRIYIRLNHDKIYEAFPMDVSTEDGKTDSSGFCLYLDRSLLAADGNQIEIFTDNKDSARIIGGLTL